MTNKGALFVGWGSIITGGKKLRRFLMTQEEKLI
jgi:hypothetical protein